MSSSQVIHKIFTGIFDNDKIEQNRKIKTWITLLGDQNE